MMSGDHPLYAHAGKESKKTFTNEYLNSNANIHEFGGKRAMHIKHCIRSQLTQDKSAKVLDFYFKI